MQMKWGILWRPMKVKLENIKYILHSIARLHNFVINERLANGEVMEEVGTGANRIYHPTVDEDVFNDAEAQEAKKKHLKGVSIIRDTMVERIANLGLRRPRGNIITRNDE